MFTKILIANRGVAAVRIARTLKRMGIASIALRTTAEKDSQYFGSFDEVYDLVGDSVAETYLDVEQILAIAARAKAEAIHPGYGFLSENAEFASEVAAAGLSFLGPTPDVINVFGLKHEARAMAQAQGVPILEGTSILPDLAAALSAADEVGFPLLLKSTAGGGGIGMQRCDSARDLEAAFESVTALAKSNFTSPGVFLEKCITKARHVEVQLFGDGRGEVIILGDRDCSLQRRNQKLVEECPAANLPESIRQSMHDSARALAASVNYASAGTIEFLYDADANEYYFLEVNTRLQVEHGVTELVYRVDIVEWMIRLAFGDLPDCSELEAGLKPSGAAVQVRLYAEDPYDNYKPTPGEIDATFPDVGRIDSWVGPRSLVSHWFDPLLANIMGFGENRSQAIDGLLGILADTKLYGTTTNIALLQQALGCDPFRAGNVDTKVLAALTYQPNELEVIRPGLEMTVQSYPGRQGYWDVGVPPSGPMDDLSFQLGNRLLDNPSDAAGLEMVLGGAKIRFRGTTRCVLTGAKVQATLDEQPIKRGQAFTVASGQVLCIDAMEDGLRAYLLVQGGLDLPDFLGSPATFVLGKFGGHQGRSLRQLDVLRWHRVEQSEMQAAVEEREQTPLHNRHILRVLLGPHAAPDFFTEAWIEELFSIRWQIDHNSNRTGIRLNGPAPEWARGDGGEAGLHPSNIHDSAYAFGAMDFTGDMPVILGPDGPSLGGFVCPAVVINADRWKLGQLVPGDEVQLQLVDQHQATEISEAQAQWMEDARQKLVVVPSLSRVKESDAARIVLYQANDVKIRQAGQEWVLLEFGEATIDVGARVLIGDFAKIVIDSGLPGVVEMIPGVRSLLLRFDTQRWTHDTMVRALEPLLEQARTSRSSTVPSRIVSLPLSWDDPACHEAIARYTNNVRPDAPWCPDNIEFIRRINGLDSVEQVEQIVFDASYLVLGLGDVYLGAPLATPVDPSHRLVTTKYNPARTWTAEGSVGIGGSYMCIYGMEGPGGYQFVGRTIPVWRNHGFGDLGDECWLLRNFDQIRYQKVDAQELLEIREACTSDAYFPETQTTQLNLGAYQEELAQNATQIGAFNQTRQRAFADELERWKASGNFTFSSSKVTSAPVLGTNQLNGEEIASPISASVWKVLLADNEVVEEGQEIAVLESMKTEVPVTANSAGTITWLVVEGQTVSAGQTLAVLAS
ncbi:MAG: urea carboxylase [Pseudomonadota bacterium]|nr:urea carboxylase [Pseudomonadota bacterium]